jgi:hypothetical protein
MNKEQIIEKLKSEHLENLKDFEKQIDWFYQNKNLILGIYDKLFHEVELNAHYTKKAYATAINNEVELSDIWDYLFHSEFEYQIGLIDLFDEFRRIKRNLHSKKDFDKFFNKAYEKEEKELNTGDYWEARAMRVERLLKKYNFIK